MPQFKDISGHTKEINILKNALLSGRVAHAYLFSGPEGVGKRMTALAFAAALNCASTEGDACGICGDCLRIAAGTHPNVIEIWPTVKEKEDVYINALDGGGLIRIHQIREIQDSIKYRVDRGKKAVIVNCAEKFMPQAANAFLKTLEEPPRDSVIMLISSRATELLPTILSRCQKVAFRPLPVEIIRGFLAERKGLSREDALLAARAGSGSLEAAIRYADSGVYEKRKEILERLRSLGKNTFEALKFAEDLSKRDDIEEVLEFMKTFVRDRLVSYEGAPELAVNGGIAPPRGAVSAAVYRSLVDSFSMIEKARQEIMPPRYANKQLAMEALLLRLTGNGALAGL